MSSTISEAEQLDHLYDSTCFKSEFHIPCNDAGDKGSISFFVSLEVVYLAGHSLGLQPKSVLADLGNILDIWAQEGNQGHHSETGWKNLEHECASLMAPLLFTSTPYPQETISVGNTLTVNLHFLLSKFYQPTHKRYKIIVEKHIFSSDLYAIKSQISFHGYDPETSIIYIENPSSTASIVHFLTDASRNNDVACLFIPGVQYYTGQVFDMKTIFNHARQIGNIPLSLELWDVDFAVWCSYKYLNGGPGSIGAYYVNRKYFLAEPPQQQHSNFQNSNLQNPSLQGWWGNDRATRFLMLPEYLPSRGANRFLVSNPPILSLVPVKSSLKIFHKVGGIDVLRERSIRLTLYLRELLEKCLSDKVIIITPKDATGAQLSLSLLNCDVDDIVTELSKRDIIVDYRFPNVLRVAPVPLYNTFKDCFLFVQMLSKILER